MHTLLLADDSITVQRVISLTFADEAFQVVTVSDGQAAIDRIASQRPDIVLAGTTMPNLTGYEVARFVRDQQSLQGLPVLLLVGAFESVDEARLKASGASGVLEKPLEPTIVISRVKELLGIKSDARPAAQSGRLVTSAETTPERRRTPREAPGSAQLRPRDPLPVRAAKASSWDDIKERSGLEPDARSVESGHGPGGGDDLDTLHAAFDSLDQHLAGRGDERQGRNPSAPLAHQGTVVDPRSPHRRPPQVPQVKPVFEMDDDWFAENEEARADRRAGRKQLAAEMGIHDVELPETPEAVNTAAPAADMNFDFGLDDEPTPTMGPTRDRKKGGAVALVPPAPPIYDASESPSPNGNTGPPAVTANAPPLSPTVVPQLARPADAPAATPPASALSVVADDFAALLAFEQGERTDPRTVSSPVPAVVHMPAPEITPAMLGEIAAIVTERLKGSVFTDQLRDALTTTMRDTAREVVTQASERVVREVASDVFERVARQVVTDASDRVMREVASGVSERVAREIVTEASERLVRDVASGVSERVAREIVTEASERLVRDVASGVSERVAREIVTEASERLVRDVASGVSERVAREVVTEASERLVRDVAAGTTERVAREIVTEASERLVRDVASGVSERVAREVVTEASERLVRDVATGVSERVAREVVTEASERLVRDVASGVSERVAREVVTEASERLVRDVAAGVSERVAREIVTEASERLVRDVAVGTTERVAREVVTEASERLVRDVASGVSERVAREVVTEASERLVRDVAAGTTERVAREVVTEASERLVREVAAGTAERVAREIVTEASERLVRDAVSETSERLVRDEIARIREKADRDDR